MSYQDSSEEHPNPNMQEDIDEAEETLSLCDLPIYSDANDYDYFSTSSSSSSDQDYFEFFSEEWSTTTTTTTSTTTTSYPPDNIVFCGKLIPYKQPISDSNDPDSPSKHKSVVSHKKVNSNWCLSSFTPKVTKNRCMTEQGSKSQHFSSSKTLSVAVPEKCRYKAGKGGEKYDFSSQKVSILTSKSRWYLFMFGLSKFPTEMEMKDMRRRQNRKSPSTLFRPDGGDEKVGFCTSRGKGLWGLIRDLGCGGHRHANAVVKASFGCIPRV